jgi:hypothetical protein
MSDAYEIEGRTALAHTRIKSTPAVELGTVEAPDAESSY